jgi:predicted TPR repeat methyltransferase
LPVLLGHALNPGLGAREGIATGPGGVGLSWLRLSQQRPGGLSSRRESAEVSATFEQAKAFFLQGLDHYQAGRFAEAERDFAASLALVPGRVSTLTNLGATRLKLGRLDDAVSLFEEALAQEPDNVEALAQCAAAFAEQGHLPRALASVDRALKLDPVRGPAWSLRGNVLRTLGRREEAADAFRRALAHGADSELNRYYLASLTGQDAPREAPRLYVQNLFDGYADEFQDHLVQVLKYRAPEILAERLRGSGRRFAAGLDLGCGTGLCGPLLRPLCGRLDGLDLSPKMVERAAATAAYDEVMHGDLVQFLRQTQRRYELAVAADVFVYVGALETVFEGVARVLEPGGVFCFTIETAPEGHDFVLQPSMRYAHSAGYIQKLSEPYGFDISATQPQTIRDDQGTPIPGLFAWLAKR